jgi:5-methylcytosine-specific restriction endonuclease McrA
VPISLGGPDTPANVQLACPPCNRAKWATLDGQIHFGC